MPSITPNHHQFDFFGFLCVSFVFVFIFALVCFVYFCFSLVSCYPIHLQVFGATEPQQFMVTGRLKVCPIPTICVAFVRGLILPELVGVTVTKMPTKSVKRPVLQLR